MLSYVPDLDSYSECSQYLSPSITYGGLRYPQKWSPTGNILLIQDKHTHCPMSHSPGIFTVKPMQLLGRLPDIFRVVSTFNLIDGSSYFRSMWMQGGYSSCSICALKLHFHGSQGRTFLNTKDCWTRYSLCTASRTWLSWTCIKESMHKHTHKQNTVFFD